MMNATVRLTADKAEVWVPSQNLEASIAALSEASGVPLAKCEVYRHDLGGGFGRRGGTQDYVHQAVAIAKEFPGVPVKLIWSREEDQAHDFFRPISQCKLSAGLDAGRQARRPACARVRPIDQRHLESRRHRQRQGPPPAAGLLGGAGRRAARLQRAEPADRIRDAQHACSGWSVARRQHQPERRLHGMLHRGGGARGRQGLARVPPRAHGRGIPSISPSSTRRPRRATGASRCLRACIAASRSSWATAATRPPSPRSR